MHQDKISIILPVYNKEKYIINILQNIKDQSYKNFECIIVDDGSTDKSGMICEDAIKGDQRFHTKHIKNQGVSHARNIGLQEASGAYITFIDADDRIDKNYLTNLYRAAIQTKADITISSIVKYWDKYEKYEKVYIPYRGICNFKDLIIDFAKVQKDTGVYGFCWGKLIRKEIIRNIFFDENYKLSEDFEFYLRVYPSITTICFDDKSCYYYYQQTENSSALVEDNKIDYLSQLYLNLKYRNFLQNMNAYTGENKKIVDQLLSNYVFFTVFHSSRLSVEDNVNTVYHIVDDEQIILNGTNFMKKIILYFIKVGNGKAVRIILSIYDVLRKKLKK